MRMIGNLDSSDSISLYFHIPFCQRKCDYCHFYVIPEQENAKEQLLEGFKLELNLLKPFLSHKKVVTIYFGGGTPSLFGPSRLFSLIETIKQTVTVLSSAEITLEANPENLTSELMRSYAEAGVNRVSIGIQTLDANLLQLLGRIHHPQTALQAIETTYRSGIENISIDLMYDLPNQTLSHWTKTLDQISTLPISHLSLYNLTIEPHTLFFKKQKQLRPLLPDETLSLWMYESAIERLENIGLQQYEISAFAKPGYESQHNTGYWIGRPFWGLGPSAFSYWQGKRFRNVANLNRYCQLLKKEQSPVDFEEELDLDAQRRELLVIQLRLKKGVLLEEFIHQHGALDQDTKQTIEQLIQEGYLYWNQNRLCLTKRGVLFYDSVATDLI